LELYLLFFKADRQIQNYQIFILFFCKLFYLKE